jgi:L-lactate dehydrogenase
MDVAIVGAGQVGSAAAFALLLDGVVGRVVLVDINGARARAEALDLSHAMPHRGHAIEAGDYASIGGVGVVVITAGANQKPGQTRLDLLATNAKIFAEIIPQVRRHAPNALLVVATNPVDVMTELTLSLSQLPRERVIGTGTLLDGVRFRVALAHHWGVAPESIHALVVGEHGDSAVPVWSRVSVSAVPAADHGRAAGKPLTAEVRERIRQTVVGAAYEIIQGKGATSYGIGGNIARICRTIALDGRTVLSLSTHHDRIAGAENCCLSTPVILGREGIRGWLDLPLDADEEKALAHSAGLLAAMAREGEKLLPAGN